MSKANAFKAEVSRDSGAERYRELTNGLVWGENFLAKEQKPERFSDMQRRVRIDFPTDWVQDSADPQSLISASPEDKSAILRVQPIARTAQSPEEYLYNYLKVSQLREGKVIAPARLKGFTGILPGTQGSSDSRIAVIYYKLNAYLFSGEVKDPARFVETDKSFLASINTFRPISSREIQGQRPQRVQYVRATSATTFAGLAKALKLSATDIEDLRIINGLYPSGEPVLANGLKFLNSRMPHHYDKTPSQSPHYNFPLVIALIIADA